MCDIQVIIGLVGLVLLVVPFLFYFYERRQNRTARWCSHKTLMLFGALLICLGLAWPALSIIVAVACRW